MLRSGASTVRIDVINAERIGEKSTALEAVQVSTRGCAMSIAILKKLCSQIPWCELAVLEPTVELALEIAREGREGRRIGTLFTLGKAEAVLAASRPLILDPLAPHAPARTHISDPDLRGTIKELALPELWLLDRHHHAQLGGRDMEGQPRGVEVLTVEHMGHERVR